MAHVFMFSASSLSCSDIADSKVAGTPEGYIGVALGLFPSLLGFFEEKCNKIEPCASGQFFVFLIICFFIVS